MSQIASWAPHDHKGPRSNSVVALIKAVVQSLLTHTGRGEPRSGEIKIGVAMCNVKATRRSILPVLFLVVTQLCIRQVSDYYFSNYYYYFFTMSVKYDLPPLHQDIRFVL